MNDPHKGIQTFLIMVVSLFILIFPAYLRCNELSQIKFVSSDIGFENPGQEDGVPDNQKQLKVYGAISFLIMFLSVINLFERFHFLPQAPFVFRRIVVLRC